MSIKNTPQEHNFTEQRRELKQAQSGNTAPRLHSCESESTYEWVWARKKPFSSLRRWTPNKQLFYFVCLIVIASNLTMAARPTLRGGQPTDFRGDHLNLNDLRAREIPNGYLYKGNIPRYPQPEFLVSNLKHETGPRGLGEIYTDSGFKGSKDECLMWFSLAVGPEEIRSAEKKLLEETFPLVPQEEDPNNFLWKFATSLAFSETSTYGSFRFTLPLQEVLNAYSQQFCSGERPVMRVYRTSVYKQGVQYTVLVHSPKHQSFSNYPLLEDQPEEAVCKYIDGHFLWRSQAMCETHRYEMDVSENQINAVPVNGRKEFYVWDQVSIALYLEPGKVLILTKDQLGNSLTYCEMFGADYMEHRKHDFWDFQEAEGLVQNLWPSTQLKKETSLQKHFEETEAKVKTAELKLEAPELSGNMPAKRVRKREYPDSDEECSDAGDTASGNPKQRPMAKEQILSDLRDDESAPIWALLSSLDREKHSIMT